MHAVARAQPRETRPEIGGRERSRRSHDANEVAGPERRRNGERHSREHNAVEEWRAAVHNGYPPVATAPYRPLSAESSPSSMSSAPISEPPRSSGSGSGGG